MDDVRCMKDYPYKMTVEQARAFGEDVLNIVAQIPHGRVTTYGHIASSSGKQRGSHGTWLEWTACVIGERGCIFQA